MIQAILQELALQKDYLNGSTVETIYLGGGTPSLLDQQELHDIFYQIQSLYTLSDTLEVTLEANPDDLHSEKIKMLKDTAVNRLSIGIQSFSEQDLKYMNRAHSAKESIACLETVLKAGFDNLTVDLIYGTPTTSDQQWKENIQRVFDYKIKHLSCYNLTVEPGTALDHFVKNKKSKPVDEEQSARQFEQLIEASDQAGYIHYEISNFALEGWYSKHNSAYWRGKSYLGIGPSAHSFNGVSRQWNIAHNAKYIQAIESGKVSFEQEILSAEDQYNEYVLTSLRTIWGCELRKLNDIGTEYKAHFLKQVSSYVDNGQVIHQAGVYTLSRAGKLLADRIAMELFF